MCSARPQLAPERRDFIGGSDARVIMGQDQAALLRLWREKRGELEPLDLSGNLVVQLGVVTETLNRHWFERNTGQSLKDVQRRVRHPVIRWMRATLDGVIAETGAVFEAKFMLPWSFSEEAAAEKYMPQLQHNMWVTNAKLAILSIITGGGKWVEMSIPADSLYQHLLLTAEKKFWRCVESGEPPRLFGVEPPRARIRQERARHLRGAALPRQSPHQVRGVPALPRLRAKTRGLASPSVRPGAGVRPQAQRRVHGPTLPHTSPRASPHRQ
jgi:predicted phage-related endonuclease